MKDIQRFSRNTLIYLFSNILRAALPFLLLPFLIRELGPQNYGLLGLVTAAFALLMTVVGMGTHAFVRVSYNQCSPEELKSVLGNAVLVLTGTSLLVILLILLGASLVTLPLPVMYIFIAVLAAFGQKVISIKLALWQMSSRPVIYGAFSIVMTALNLGVSIILVFLVHMQAEGRILGMWLPATVLGPLLLWVMVHRGEVRFKFSRQTLGKILRYGVPLIPHSLALSLLVLVERSVLSGSPDSAALGTYFAAFQLSLPISILANSVNLQFRAWSDKMMADQEHSAVVAASYLLMFLLLIAALLYAWVLGFVYTDIVGPELKAGYGISVILIASSMLRGCYLVVVKGLMFNARTALLMRISVALAALFSIALLFFNDLYTVAYLNLGFNGLLFVCVWAASAIVYPQPWFAWLRNSGRR